MFNPTLQLAILIALTVAAYVTFIVIGNLLVLILAGGLQIFSMRKAEQEGYLK